MRGVLLGAAIGVALATATPASAAGVPVERKPLLDVRASQKTAVPKAAPATERALRRFVAALGPQAFLSRDRVTGAVRFLGRTDGYLSAAAPGDARDVALRWVRRHRTLLGLAEADIAGLRLAHRYRSPLGVTRLIFQQTHRGIPAFDNSLRINVARDGRIVNVGGSPRSGLQRAATTPGLTSAQAVLAAAAAVDAPSLPPLRALGAPSGPRRTTHFLGRHNAKLTLVSMSPTEVRLAWRVWYEQSHNAVWDVLVDARTGDLIRRANQVKWANGLAWDYYPGAPSGGDPRLVDFSRWLDEPGRLRGNYAHVYNDADGTEDFTTDIVDPTQESMGDIVTPDEEIRPRDITSGDWDYEYVPIPSPLGNCPEVAGCTWNHLVNGSWRPNRDQDGTQVFYFVNTFAEHLKSPPINFDEAAGNFQFRNTTGNGKGNDGIYTSNMDAAGQVALRPIPLLWSDNANMLTRPDGQAPRMQMFLFEPIPGAAVGLDYPFSDVSGGDDATVVYHEYTHGLSNRLVIDNDGHGALNAAQSGAMGEAWSDFYAFDFLMKQGHVVDTEAPGELKLGFFTDGGQDLVRSEAIDCTPGAPISVCPRKRSALAESEGGGGYTYEHFGRIAGGPQVHADGEIWSQTLMDLRRRLVRDHGSAQGTERIESYVTRAMELAPDEPSFIDMRNAILQADVLRGARDVRRIWEAFAARGMGASAAAVDGKDTAPVAGFDLPINLPPADTLGPAVTIDSPRENGVLRGERAVISGTALDDAGVRSLTLDGTPVSLQGTSWSVKLKLRAGTHRVTISATDIEGRLATATRTLRSDRTKPRITGVRLRRRAGRLQVAGRALDDSAIARLTVNGRRVGVSGTGRFFAALPVRRGPVTIVATDRAGRRKTKRVK